MKDNAEILSELLTERSISEPRGVLMDRRAAIAFTRRVIEEGSIDQPILYDDGLNGLRSLRPVEIMHTYAYYGCLGAFVQAGAEITFPRGKANRIFIDILREQAVKYDSDSLVEAMSGLIGLEENEPRFFRPAPIDESTPDGRLHAALKRYDLLGAFAALDAGANPHLKIGGSTFMHFAARMAGCEDIDKMIDKLLECGVSINATDDNDYQPLHNAACVPAEPAASKAMMEYLLDRGADFYARAWSWKNTPLHSAISNEEVGNSLALIEIAAERGLHLETSDAEGKTVLHLACMVGHESVVQALIDSGAKVDALDASGRTPLHYAALRGSEYAARALLKAHAKLNIQDKDGNTPLHLCHSGKETLYSVLNTVMIYPSRNAHDFSNRTPLPKGELTVGEAAMQKRRRIASALIALGAKQDIPNIAGLLPQDMPDFGRHGQTAKNSAQNLNIR